jgi:hypothetical protein
MIKFKSEGHAYQAWRRHYKQVIKRTQREITYLKWQVDHDRELHPRQRRLKYRPLPLFDARPVIRELKKEISRLSYELDFFKVRD